MRPTIENPISKLFPGRCPTTATASLRFYFGLFFYVAIACLCWVTPGSLSANLFVYFFLISLAVTLIPKGPLFERQTRLSRELSPVFRQHQFGIA